MIDQARAAVGNIESMLSALDINALREACDRLASAAQSVTVIGTMSAAALVDYIGYMAGMALPEWHCVTDPGAAGAARLAGLGA